MALAGAEEPGDEVDVYEAGEEEDEEAAQDEGYGLGDDEALVGVALDLPGDDA